MLRTRRLPDGANAALPQLVPDPLPGYMIVPCRLGGVKMPCDRSLATIPRHSSRSAGVGPHTVSGVSGPCGISSGSFGEVGCVGHAASPATSLGGVARSSTSKSGLPGLAIEHEQPAGLGRLGDGRHHPAVARHVHQHRLRRQVVVPQVVMHRLERPHERAGGAAQRDHRIGVRVGARTQAAEEVGARAAGGHEHEVAGGVDVDDRPGVAGAGASRLAVERAPAPALLRRCGRRRRGPRRCRCRRASCRRSTSR